MYNINKSPEKINKIMQEAKQYYQSYDHEKAGSIVKELLPFVHYLTTKEKHQIANYLWHTDLKEQALMLFSVEDITEKYMGKVLKHFDAWKRSHYAAYSTPMSIQICKIAAKYIQEYDTSDHIFCTKAGLLCNLHEQWDNAIAIFRVALQITSRSNVDIFISQMLLNNVAMSSLFGGKDGSAFSLAATLNALSEIPKYMLNPAGNGPPYSGEYLQSLQNFPNETIYKASDRFNLVINRPPPEDSGLSFPHFTEFEDRDINLLEFSNIQQEHMALFRLANNHFILYDAAVYLLSESYAKALVESRKTSIRYVAGKIEHGVYVAAFTHNYYHWIIEAMAKLVHLIDIGYFKRYPQAVLAVINESDTPFIQESLKLIKFPAENTKVVNTNAMIEFKKLHIPVSVPWSNPKLTIANPSQLHVPNPYLIQRLNQLYNPNPLPLEKRRKIIYLPRPDTENRKSTFDPLLIPQLKELFKDDLVIFPSSPPDLMTQMAIFREARIIFGPHGAAFSNIIFAAPNQTAVIVFPVGTIYFDHPFSHLATSLGMYFWTLPTVSSPYQLDYPSSPEIVEDIIRAVVAASKFMDSL